MLTNLLEMVRSVHNSFVFLCDLQLWRVLDSPVLKQDLRAVAGAFEE